MEQVTQRKTTAAAAGFTKPAGAKNSAFDNGAKLPSNRGGLMRLLPELDLSALKPVNGPPPTSQLRGAKGTTKYDSLFDLLTADNMGRTGIPDSYRQAIASAAGKYLKHHPKLNETSRLVVRCNLDGTCGVWRIARKEQA